MTIELKRILIRRGSTAQWTADNAVLSLGELGLDTTTGRMRMGDGTTAFLSLPIVDLEPFPTIATLAASDKLQDGATYSVNRGYNGEPETFTYDADSTATADGALIVEATSMGAGRLISTRTEFASKAEMLADRRTFEVGTVLDVVGVSAYKAVTGASDEVNAGGQNLEKVALDLGLGTAAYEDATAFVAAPASPSSGDLLYYDGTDWVRLPKGADDQILTLASGFPSWADATGGGGGGATRYSASTSTVNSTTTVIPSDGTLPQSTEGKEALSISSVVVGSGEKVKVNVSVMLCNGSNNGRNSVAVFRGTTCIWANGSTTTTADPFQAVAGVFEDDPGAGTYTYSLRFGPVIGTTYINADFSGTAIFGAAGRTDLILEVY